MKVKELIEELKLHDPENECWLDACCVGGEDELMPIKSIYTTGLFNNSRTIMRTYIQG